ncbi:MAG TPA: NlpC/P60 family protein [Gaiellaceae bacterium]|nr:NlpC/P60 family protein [Gaiellaceae bacterium]
MLVLPAVLLALAAVQPGGTATVDVSVATLWRAPGIARAIDAPALSNPVDLDAWNRNLASTRARAGLDPLVVTQALYGEQVEVLAVRGSWAKVAVPDQPSPLDRRGYPGWLPLRQLTTTRRGSTGLVLVSKQGTVKAGMKAIEVSYGTRLPSGVVATAGDWRKVPPPTGASIVASAKRFLGLRYLWGGVSSWGFDCSGLVWDVFRVHGVVVPRDTGPQSRGGTRVSPGALRPGDLVFYGSPATHVAIAAGHGKMIEAPDSAHAVRLVPLRPGFTAARRYTR